MLDETHNLQNNGLFTAKADFEGGALDAVTKKSDPFDLSFTSRKLAELRMLEIPPGGRWWPFEKGLVNQWRVIASPAPILGSALR